MSRSEIEARNYDIKAVNPHAKKDQDTRTPEEILDLSLRKAARPASAGE